MNYYQSKGSKCPHKAWDKVSRRELVEWGFTEDLEVIRVSRSFKSTMEWAISKGLMPEYRVCKICLSKMKITKTASHTADGYAY